MVKNRRYRMKRLQLLSSIRNWTGLALLLGTSLSLGGNDLSLSNLQQFVPGSCWWVMASQYKACQELLTRWPTMREAAHRAQKKATTKNCTALGTSISGAHQYIALLHKTSISSKGTECTQWIEKTYCTLYCSHQPLVKKCSLQLSGSPNISCTC